MDSLVSFVLEQQQSGAPAFDPRAARPKCQVCGRDAWMQWDGSYADYCSRGCRDTALVSASRARGAPLRRPPKYSDDNSRRGQSLAPRKSILRWEEQFSPSNRHLPGREESQLFSAKTDFLVGAAAAKRAAQALKARARRGISRRRSSQEERKALPLSPRRVSALSNSTFVGFSSSLPLQRQRTVARFNDGDVVKEEALREYQAALSRQLTREQRRRFSDVVQRRRSRTSVVSSISSLGRPSFLRDLENKGSSSGEASRKPSPPPSASGPLSEAATNKKGNSNSDDQTSAPPESTDDHKSLLRLEASVAEVQTLLKEQREEQARLQKRLQEIDASLQDKLKASVDASVAEALNASPLLRDLQQKGQEAAAALQRSQERLLAQLETQRQDVRRQCKAQDESLEKTRQRLQRLEEQATAAAAVVVGTERSRKTKGAEEQPSSKEGVEPQDRPSQLSSPKTRQKSCFSSSQPNFLQRRDALFREAVAAAVRREEEAGGWTQPYEGMLTVQSTGVTLTLHRRSRCQERLTFGSRLRLTIRCHCAKNRLEERRSDAFADLQMRLEFAFRVSWSSASAATAAAACIQVQLWTDGEDGSSSDFLGAARLPLPFFAAPWMYTAPLCWDPEIGGQLQVEGFLGDSTPAFDACLPPPLASAAVNLTLHFTPHARKQPHFQENTDVAEAKRLTNEALATRLSTTPFYHTENQSGSEVERRFESSDRHLPEALASQSECPLIENVLRRLKRLKVVLRKQAPLTRWRAVVVNSQKLERHLRRQPGTSGFCTNSFCGEKVRKLPDLYSEEEFRVWGLCRDCQNLMFPTPIPEASPIKVSLRPPREVQRARLDKAKKQKEFSKQPAFSELRLDSLLPVAFPEPAFLWPSALQLLHAQRFADVRLQEQVRSCLDSTELVQLLKKMPELKFFERKDWARRASAALRTCLLLLVQQHPKLQLLLSSLRGSLISYEDPLQSYELEQETVKDGEPVLPPNLAGHILMEICDGLAPPSNLEESVG